MKIVECSELHRVDAGIVKIDYCMHENAPTTDGYNSVCVISRCPEIIALKSD